jgi:predicted RNA-binding Zn ribbon-like protein
VSSDSAKKSGVGPDGDLVVAFVNTRDIDEGFDSIADPEALERWVADSGIGVGAKGIDAEGHRRLLGVRESLRALLRANNGGDASDAELAPLREAAGGVRYRASVGRGGELAIAPEGDGADALAARLLLAIERLQAKGSWERLKVCPDDSCEWAFIDTSRNRSRTWCSMEVCGNRSKTRRYRHRRSAG